MKHSLYNPQNKKHHLNEQLSRASTIASSTNISGIYILYMTSALRTIFNNFLKYFFLPTLIATSISQMICAWHHAKITKMKNINIIKALVETASTTAATITIVGEFAAPTIFFPLFPLIFLSILSLRTAIGVGLELYYLNKYFHADTPEKIERFNKKYNEQLVSTAIVLCTLLLNVVAMAGVYIEGQYALAGFGVAAGVITTAYSLYTMYIKQKKYSDSQTIDLPVIDDEEITYTSAVTNNAKISKALSMQASPRNIFAEKISKQEEIPLNTFSSANPDVQLDCRKEYIADRNYLHQLP